VQEHDGALFGRQALQGVGEIERLRAIFFHGFERGLVERGEFALAPGDADRLVNDQAIKPAAKRARVFECCECHGHGRACFLRCIFCKAAVVQYPRGEPVCFGPHLRNEALQRRVFSCCGVYESGVQI